MLRKRFQRMTVPRSMRLLQLAKAGQPAEAGMTLALVIPFAKTVAGVVCKTIQTYPYLGV